MYPDPANIKKQLTKYTDDGGNVSSQRAGAYVYGPYLSSIPSMPFGNGGGQIGSANGGGVGWVYDSTTAPCTPTPPPRPTPAEDSTAITKSV